MPGLSLEHFGGQQFLKWSFFLIKVQIFKASDPLKSYSAESSASPYYYFYELTELLYELKREWMVTNLLCKYHINAIEIILLSIKIFSVKLFSVYSFVILQRKPFWMFDQLRGCY